jgi:hypothetical protein
MEKEILASKEYADFSPFDIFQYIEDNKKNVWSQESEDEIAAKRLYLFTDLLETTKKQILFFSGNLSFINFKDKDSDVFNTIEKLVKRGVSIKVVCRVDVAGKKNIEKLLSLNNKYGENLIEIRHRKQPLRATIIDGKVINLKEVIMPKSRKGEFDKKLFVFYTIKDKDWAEWLTRIFWNMFSSSIGSEKRLNELRKIKAI